MGQPVNKPYDFDRIKNYDENINYAIKISEEWHNKPTDYPTCRCCGTEWPSLIFKKMSPVLVLHDSIVFGYSICPHTEQPTLYHINVPSIAMNNYYMQAYLPYINQIKSENKNGTN